MRRMQQWVGVLALVCAVPAFAQVASGVPVVQGDRSVVPQCEVATDATYGVTPAHPVKVGGGATTVSARERQYLGALRGPEGQTISFKRLGSVQGPDKTILDHYEVTWPGLAEPRAIYLDAYRWEPPRAPMGMVCGAAINLARPPADPFLMMDRTTALAIRWGAANAVTGIPLSATEPDRYGTAWDSFRQAAVKSHEATKAGTPFDPEDPPRGVGLQPLLLVAYPLACGDRTVRPRSVTITDANGAEAPKAEEVRGDALANALPGVTLPDGSIGQRLRINLPRQGHFVVITYDDRVCEGDAREVKWPTQMTGARPIRQVPVLLTSESALTPPPADNPVRLLVVTDPTGAPQIADYAAGPEALLDPALKVITQWMLEPVKWNGVPVVTSLTVPVRVMTAPAGGFVPGGGTPTAGGPPVLNALSTINLLRTQDMPTLPPAQCAVSADADFGRSAASAIPVGGGVENVVERARLYLLALRGEKGQGLTIKRSGDGPAPPATEIEQFDVTRTGDSGPTRLYFDATRWADIVAPQGFVCTGPMILRPPR
jgi:hypothetical protein